MWNIEVIQTDLVRSIPNWIVAYHLDSPKPGDIFDDYLLPITGWILGEQGPITSLHITSEMETVVILVEGRRPDIRKLYQNKYSRAEKTGFHYLLPIHAPSGSLELLISAKTEDELIELGKITVRVEFHSPLIQSKFKPIILTGLGRSGTTACMQAIGHYPEIVMERTYPYETRIAQHLVESLIRAIPVDRVFNLPTEVTQYLGRDFLHHNFQRYVDYIDNCYEIIARINHQPEALYFIEKFLRFKLQSRFHCIYPDSKEIILVRDFRDMLCSVLSFNKRRGYFAFDRQHFKSDLDYIQNTKGPNRLLAAWRKRKKQALLVRYEDLVENFEETITGIFEYLEVNTMPSLLKKICKSTPTSSQQFDEHMTSQSHEKSIGRWRKELPSEFITIANEVMGDALSGFGYEV